MKCEKCGNSNLFSTTVNALIVGEDNALYHEVVCMNCGNVMKKKRLPSNFSFTHFTITAEGGKENEKKS